MNKMKKNILVFPCGSEIALEIYRSLKFSTYFNLIGGSSVDDHGRFVFENYIGDIPFITDADFIPAIKKIVQENKIDAIYPAMDAVIVALKENEEIIGCKIISSDLETVKLCLSKKETYKTLKNIIKVPHIYQSDQVKTFPVFGKPDIGYGSRGTKKIETRESLKAYMENNPGAVLCEYLQGEEYTVDCFTDRKGELLFYAPRIRKRIMNGISVNTIPYIEQNSEFTQIVEKINEKVKFRGAWFVQLKRNNESNLVLLEIAARLGGSSSLFRAKGINFVQLTLFDAFEYSVSIIENNYSVELDRALDNKFKINLQFNHLYLDFDDVVIVDNKVNPVAIACVYHFMNRNVKIHLITKHQPNIYETLKKYRLETLFDEVIPLKKDDDKWKQIKHLDSIFIDDSFSERKQVQENLGLPVFSVDMLELIFDIYN